MSLISQLLWRSNNIVNILGKNDFTFLGFMLIVTRMNIGLSTWHLNFFILNWVIVAQLFEPVLFGEIAGGEFNTSSWLPTCEGVAQNFNFSYRSIHF